MCTSTRITSMVVIILLFFSLAAFSCCCRLCCRHGAITSRGRQMVSLPLRPDISSFLLTALELDCVEAAAPIAAMLSVEGVFIRPGQC